MHAYVRRRKGRREKVGGRGEVRCGVGWIGQVTDPRATPTNIHPTVYSAKIERPSYDPCHRSEAYLFSQSGRISRVLPNMAHGKDVFAMRCFNLLTAKAAKQYVAQKIKGFNISEKIHFSVCHSLAHSKDSPS